MNNTVLVAHASKYGATAEIAEKVGEVLRRTGLGVDVSPVKAVKDVTAYGAVVLGSAAYIGQWRREAVTFLRTNERLLAERPVWLFASGPTGKGDPLQLTKGWKYPDKLKPLVEGIRPRDVAVFGGALDAAKMNFFDSFIIKRVKAPTGDFRDWNAISSWAAAIAKELKSTR